MSLGWASKAQIADNYVYDVIARAEEMDDVLVIETIENQLQRNLEEARAAKLRTLLKTSSGAQREELESGLHRAEMHPGYEYFTTEGPRKNWDYADEPPEGEGWIRNVHRGRRGTADAGWDRLSYTEESYWMRPITNDKEK